MKTLEQSKNWFRISDEGWKSLNAGRPLHHLVREAIQNAMDEATATEINVQIKQVAGDYNYFDITIRDNGSGFADIKAVDTVFMSDKQDDPKKRGRLGRGLKELISASEKSTIATKNFVVQFDADGRTLQQTDYEIVGTTVNARIKTQENHNLFETINFLEEILSTEKRIIINGKENKKAKVILEYKAKLPTVVFKNFIISQEEHECTVQVIKTDGPAKIFEMEIPVQEIETPYSLNVLQRLPITDGRDKMASWELQKFYASFLEKYYTELTVEELSFSWVKKLMGQWFLSREVKKAVFNKVFGENTLIGTDDDFVNDRAKQLGMKVLDPEALGYEVKEYADSVGLTTMKFMKNVQENTETKTVEPTQKELKTIELIKKMWAEINKTFTLEVIIVEEECFIKEAKVACIGKKFCCDNTYQMDINRKSGFNTENPLNPYCLGVIMHEFAHVDKEGCIIETHEMDFVERLEYVAGHLLLKYAKKNHDEDFDKATASEIESKNGANEGFVKFIANLDEILVNKYSLTKSESSRMVEYSRNGGFLFKVRKSRGNVWRKPSVYWYGDYHEGCCLIDNGGRWQINNSNVGICIIVDTLMQN